MGRAHPALLQECRADGMGRYPPLEGMLCVRDPGAVHVNQSHEGKVCEVFASFLHVSIKSVVSCYGLIVSYSVTW